jgi:hypothetical protein
MHFSSKSLGGDMPKVQLVMQYLSVYFPINKARLNFLANFIQALYISRTVNLVKISEAFVGHANNESCYKRIQRFFKSYDLDDALVAVFCSSILRIKEKFILSIDRTNWKFGKVDINILAIGIFYNNIAVPVLWKILPKQGNSNTKERIELIERFLSIFGEGKIDFITGDREFIGKEWSSYLISKSINFYIRIKGNERTHTKSRKNVPIKNLFRSSKKFDPKHLDGKRKLWGVDVYIVGMKIINDYVIIATNSEPTIALFEYRKRWSIETMFGALKTRGFNFEDTHLNIIERVSKLLALMSIAFAWACVTGEWHNRAISPIKRKKHGRLAKSIFRTGLDILRTIFLGTKTNAIKIQEVVNFLSCT